MVSLHHNQLNSAREALGQDSSLFSLSHGLHGRADTTYHAPAHAYSESTAGSTATTPSSNTASVAYSHASASTPNLYPVATPAVSLAAPYTAAPGLWIGTSSYGYAAIPTESLHGMPNVGPRNTVADPSTTHIGPIRTTGTRRNPPVSPISPPSVRTSYSGSTPGIRGQNHLRSGPPMDFGRPAYGPTAHEAPRPMAHTQAFPNSHTFAPPAPNPTIYAGTLYNQPQSASDRAVELPFKAQDDYHEIRTHDGQHIVPVIEQPNAKGFFLSSDGYTCYRRNYFSVECTYRLDPHPGNRPMYLVRRTEHATDRMLIQAMGMSLSATVDQSGGKIVDLVQQTPKRDKGPQCDVQKIKFCPVQPFDRAGPQPLPPAHGYPMPIPYGVEHLRSMPQSQLHLPLQSVPEAQATNEAPYNPTSPNSSSHTFERIQYKSATANNGKRRAQQQFYVLHVELHVDIRRHENEPPNWVKVASKASQPVVVRGRSPSHYKHDGFHLPRGPGSTGGAGGAGASGGGGRGMSTMQWPPMRPPPAGPPAYPPASYRYGGPPGGNSHAVSCQPQTQATAQALMQHLNGLAEVMRPLQESATSSTIVSAAGEGAKSPSGYSYWPHEFQSSEGQMIKSEPVTAQVENALHLYQPIPIAVNRIELAVHPLDSSRGLYVREEAESGAPS